VALCSGIIFIAVLFSVLTVVCVARRCSKKRKKENIKVDGNDIYGTYYEGEVWYSTVEDTNPYYAS